MQDVQTKTLTSYNVWLVAYCMAQGIKVVRVVPGAWKAIELDDSDGRATAAMTGWLAAGRAANLRAFVDCYKELQYWIHAS